VTGCAVSASISAFCLDRGGRKSTTLVHSCSDGGRGSSSSRSSSSVWTAEVQRCCTNAIKAAAAAAGAAVVSVRDCTSHAGKASAIVLSLHSHDLLPPKQEGTQTHTHSNAAARLKSALNSCCHVLHWEPSLQGPHDKSNTVRIHAALWHKWQRTHHQKYSGACTCRCPTRRPRTRPGPAPTCCAPAPPAPAAAQRCVCAARGCSHTKPLVHTQAAHNAKSAPPGRTDL